jgi:hypothetical protein
MEAARLQHECKNLQEQVVALTNQLREAKKEYRESVEESEKRLIEAERELSGKRMHHDPILSLFRTTILFIPACDRVPFIRPQAREKSN